MDPKSSPLHDAFLEDHRKLTRGLLRLLGTLKENDVGAAQKEADELDRLAGPHMEFEETVFYPTLEKLLGSEFVDQLYHEHGLGQDAVRALLAHEAATPLPEKEQRRLVGQVEMALEHALSCGSLLSHLAAVGEADQRAMLHRLIELRSRGRRWTELSSDGRG